MASRWQQIGFLWFIGVLAAAQLAKFAVLAATLRQAHALSLTEIGLLISLLEVGGAAFGFAAGAMIGRIGARRFLLCGLAVLALSGVAEAIAPGPGSLLAARAFEGLGYVLVVVAAPTMIAAIATEQQRGPALALWSTFVPLGVALGSALTGMMAAWSGTSGTLLMWAGAFVLACGLALQLPANGQVRPSRLALPNGAAWLSTAAFGIYTTLVCALTALLPTYLVEQHGALLAVASTLAGVVSAAALPGGLTMMIILRRHGASERKVLWLSGALLLASAIPAAVIFDGGSGGATVLTSAACAAATVLLGGLAPPLILARLPHFAGARSGDDPRLAVAQGLLTQFGAGGALIGPPAAGLVVETMGWGALGAFIAVLTISFLMVLLTAEWLAGRGDGALSASKSGVS